MDRACFLDRDGVIIEDVNYLSDPGHAKLCPGVAEALNLLRKNGYKLIVVSNQSGVARGYFTMKAVEAVQMRIEKLLKKEDAAIDAWYNCPHLPEGKVKEFAVDCDCRKPKPGLLLRAAKEHSLEIPQSFMIGDKIRDLEAGFNAGCKRAALVLTGNDKDQVVPEAFKARVVVAGNILEAVGKLLCRKP